MVSDCGIEENTSASKNGADSNKLRWSVWRIEDEDADGLIGWTGGMRRYL